MNIKTWFSENKAASYLALVFVVGTGFLGYLAWSAWDDYGAVSAEYTSKASELDRLSKSAIFPSASNLRKLTETLNQSQANLDKLNEALQKYRVLSFGSFDKIKPQDQPQYFQDSLRSEVTAIKSLATTSGSTLPPSFYLGLDEYENRLPQPEQLLPLAKQLSVLTWMAKSVVSLKGVIVAEFSRIPSDLLKSSPPQKLSPQAAKSALSSSYNSLGSIRITLRCGQGALRDMINAISKAPYFLVIEDIKIQNSVGEPPLRDAAPANDQTADGTTSIQRLPIIVGRESLNVLLKMRIIDFPTPKNQPEPVK